jgi:hypothetical protein
MTNDPNEELRDQINKAERAFVSSLGFWSFVIHSGIRVSELSAVKKYHGRLACETPVTQVFQRPQIRIPE